MAFLLNPNIAYLVIVVGFLLTVFAILTPGTGLFEAGAVTVLGIAAWQIYNLSVNGWALVLLVIGLVPFIMALRRKQVTLNLVLTLAALVLGSVFLFREEKWWQPAVNPILAVVVSLLAGGFFWLMTTKALAARETKPAHDLSDLVGAEGEARTDVFQEGSVYVGGELWTAYSDGLIKSGARIRVLAREGFVLHVKEEK